MCRGPKHTYLQLDRANAFDRHLFSKQSDSVFKAEHKHFSEVHTRGNLYLICVVYSVWRVRFRVEWLMYFHTSEYLLSAYPCRLVRTLIIISMSLWEIGNRSYLFIYQINRSYLFIYLIKRNYRFIYQISAAITTWWRGNRVDFRWTDDLIGPSMIYTVAHPTELWTLCSICSASNGPCPLLLKYIA